MKPTSGCKLMLWPVVVATLAIVLVANNAAADDWVLAQRVRHATLAMEYRAAAKLLEGAPVDDTLLGVERGRLLLYETQYDEAVAAFARPDVLHTPEGARLGNLAANCARAMAGAYEVHDDEHGVVVRMQDDHDAALVPILAEVVGHVRESLDRNLGVRLPHPLRIELVRDQFALSAMTGLPEQAARTTGTVAVANWGRVAMLTPRATFLGYPWLDTLAHELAHLALGRGTLDRAPLWLQEGVAKVEESRWRAPDPFDTYPPADALAAIGFDRGLARELDDLGPSVAMLPTPQHAMVVFAEVESFVRYFMQEAGALALPQLIVALRENGGDADFNLAMEQVTGRDLTAWNEAWKKQVLGVPVAELERELPPELALGNASPVHPQAGRKLRLGELLLDRGHAQAASVVLQQARDLAPRELRVRGSLGRALLAVQKSEEAWHELVRVDPPMVSDAAAFSVRGLVLAERRDRAGADWSFFRAVARDPWGPFVACEMLMPPMMPSDPARAGLCDAARRWPRN